MKAGAEAIHSTSPKRSEPIKRPRHRPTNDVRIASMLRWFQAAKTDCRVIDPDDMRELYLGTGGEFGF
jgi:hypothetical protein